jgi:hypothetical protein
MRIRFNSEQPGAPTRARVQASLRQRGFALIEILIAGCILGFSVVSLYSAYSFGFALIRLSQENVRADQILVQKMETLRAYPWSQTAPGSGIVPTTFTESFAPGATSCGAVYNGTIDITPAPVAESYSSTLRQVTVNLNWISGGVTRSRSITTFVALNGIQNIRS